MKFGKITIVTVLMVTCLLSLTSCSKDDGAIPERIGIEDVPVITTNLVKNNGTLDTIFLASQAAYQGQIKIAMYFPGQPTPSKIDVVVRKNAAATNVKVFQADVTSYPATITVTAAQINTLFAQAQLTSGDTYDFAPDIYVGQKKYQAFPLVGLGNGQGVTGMSSIGFGEYVRVRIRP
ncbi:hypothetical protein LZZ85_11730 [Terrimonas sp. NA20]|uniref:DUF1735 domain-containing protein n=1 Tax=Terrimonas ginsenosidimutans TaxID=2908004 RepID=A0ABS9KRL0_9BACT|nr:hypothetical protein [Terrimonas ginsenosidimutans]MCG2614959.1 hypothetical protein [Terrimonas ginsenosidimutans]